MDLKKELQDAQARARFLLEEHFKTLGVIAFIEYQIKEEEKCSQETSSAPILSANATQA